MITVKNATYDKCKKHPLTTKSSTDYCCSTHIYDDKNMTIKLNMGKLNLAHSISLIGISLNIDVACFIYYRIYKLNLTIEHTMNGLSKYMVKSYTEVKSYEIYKCQH